MTRVMTRNVRTKSLLSCQQADKVVLTTQPSQTEVQQPRSHSINNGRANIETQWTCVNAQLKPPVGSLLALSTLATICVVAEIGDYSRNSQVWTGLKVGIKVCIKIKFFNATPSQSYNRARRKPPPNPPVEGGKRQNWRGSFNGHIGELLIHTYRL